MNNSIGYTEGHVHLAADLKKPSVVIVSPALSDANNGNWQTARRWQQMLSARYEVRVVKVWEGHPPGQRDATMLALHARRSAASVANWVAAHASDPPYGVGHTAVSATPVTFTPPKSSQPGTGSTSNICPNLAVILTGTDLYRDIQTDTDAQRSLQIAGQLVVLQSLGLQQLPSPYRGKTRAILQSTTSLPAFKKSGDTLRCIAVGHLRSEKSPDTLMHAAAMLDDVKGLRIDHLGAGLEEALTQLALQTMRQHPHYRWLGAKPHNDTRQRIRKAHVLIHPSRMEGGAHVVMEAVCSGTPVLASRIDGNVGMLGEDYAGYFPVGDAQALAALIRQIREDVRNIARRGPTVGTQTLYETLMAQCALRAPLFAPEREQEALCDLLDTLRNAP